VSAVVCVPGATVGACEGEAVLADDQFICHGRGCEG
jgi:hypothetical protein